MLLLCMPSAESGLQSLYAILFILLFFIIISIYVNRVLLTSVDWFMLSVLFFSSIMPIVFQYKIMAIRYLLSIVLIIFAIRNKGKLIYNQKEMILFLFFPSVLIMSFLRETHPPFRFSLFNGDPNYTILLFLTVFFSLEYFVRLRGYRVLLYTQVLFMTLITDSRMGQLMLILFFLTKINYINRFMSKKYICLIVFILTTFAQPFLVRFMDDLTAIFPNTDSTYRLMQIGDSSNFKRLQALNEAMNFLSDSDSVIYYGSDDYIKESGSNTIPHHWLILTSVTYGGIFAASIFMLYLYIIFISHAVHRKYLNLFFISSGILGVIPLLLCIPMIFIIINDDR